MKKWFILLALVVFTGLVFSQTTPEWLWANSAGGTDYDYGYSIAIDSNGNSFVTGRFKGVANFGTYTLTSTYESGYGYSYDIFIAKLDSTGNWLWAMHAGGTGSNDAGYGISIDSMGNCYVTGYFQYTAEFGQTTLTSTNQDSFVAKLDFNGNWLWATCSTGTGWSRGNAISADINGNCYVTGDFYSEVGFGSYTLTGNGDNEIFVSKLDANGNWLWANSAGGANSDTGWDVATDSNGNCYITGDIRGTVDFGSIVLTDTGNTDAFVAKLDTNGNWLWAARAGESGSSWGKGISITTDGSIFATGGFCGTASFGSTEYSSYMGDSSAGPIDSDDIFVAKLDANGNWLWAKRAGGTLNDACGGISTDGYGNCYITGYYSISFFNTIIFKYDTNGNWYWSVGGTDSFWGESIATDNSGNSYILGNFSGTADFGTTTLTGTGADDTDTFVAKLSSCGVGTGDDLLPGISGLSRLHNAFPNPIRAGGITNIKADIALSESGSITIYNMRGQVVERHQLGSGSHNISFPGKDIATGIYFYRLKTPSVNEMKKLVLLK